MWWSKVKSLTLMMQLWYFIWCVFNPLTVYWVLQSDCWELPEGQRGDTQPLCVSKNTVSTNVLWFQCCTSIFTSTFTALAPSIRTSHRWQSVSQTCMSHLFSLRRFNIQPVCGDLQSQILKCYKDNTGRTLSCSGIASAYMQCVDNAKKVRLNLENFFSLSLSLEHLEWFLI